MCGSNQELTVGSFYLGGADPLLRRLCKLVMMRNDASLEPAGTAMKRY
jgi:hypothetical protein